MTIPYTNSKSSKKQQVASMFNSIAHSYDLLNRILSFGIDIIWRKRAVRVLKKYQPQIILDIATGTGDFALAIVKKIPLSKVIGIDISENMLEKAKQKIARKKMNDRIGVELGDSEKMKFADASFDAITVAFGVRNFENLDTGLFEMYRVIKPGGVAVILEFSKPEHFPIKQLYFFYFNTIVPAIGKLFSKDSRAYNYLPESVDAFPYGDAFLEHATHVGFAKTKHIQLSFGIASLYVCEK